MHTKLPSVLALLTALAACAGLPDGPAPASVSPKAPEALLADGDAALERNELPEAARAYRQAAEASDDEAVAEQATRGIRPLADARGLPGRGALARAQPDQ